METLNQYSGLFSLLAVIAAIIVPYLIHRIEKKERKQDLKDELDALTSMNHFPMSTEQREHYAKIGSLERKLRRK